MSEDLPESLKFRDTMRRLKELRRQSHSGVEYWRAREVMGVLGYVEWRNFDGLVERASASLLANNISPSHHIVEANKMMEVGKSGQRKTKDLILSRAACYLIAMNGDPSKPEIAAAQAYFTIQTRTAEISEARSEDQKRIELREKVRQSFKTVSGVAQQAGVPNSKQAIFHDARYQGLYGHSRRDVVSLKGLRPSDSPFDHMGALELSANDFQMNLAAETIEKEGIRGEHQTIRKNKEVAQKVRQTMIDSGSRPPEELPAAEPIKEVQKRLKIKSQKKLPKSPTS
ncbi:MAG: DNA damage-inducible protein D [Alphaproteobacteria bacterium]